MLLNVDSLQADGNTCLHLAAELGDVPVTRFLHSQKAKPNLVNNVSIFRSKQGTLIRVISRLLEKSVSVKLSFMWAITAVLRSCSFLLFECRPCQKLDPSSS